MIIRHRHSRNFTAVPNAIFEDKLLSVEAKGVLGYLLSRPPNWQARHDHLQRELDVGRKLLRRCMDEIREAGYGDCDARQGRDEHNRFTPLNYIIRDVPKRAAATIPEPQRLEPRRPKNIGNNKEEIKTDLNNPFSKSLPNYQADGAQAQVRQDEYTPFGMHALATGQHAVFVGSKPHQAWLAFRGLDGMPGFIDRAVIKGQPHEVVWMPSLYPPDNSKKGSTEHGSDSNG